MENGTNTSKDSRAPSSVNADAYKIGPLGSEPLIKADVDIPNQDLLPTSNSLRLQDQERRIVNLEHQMRSKTQNQVEILRMLKEIRQHQVDEKRQQITLTDQVCYTFIHPDHPLIMIGYSGRFFKKKNDRGRRKEHESDGWIYIAHCSGSQQGMERPLLDKLKELSIKPSIGKEIFNLTRELVTALITLGWPLGDRPLENLFKGESQTSLVSQ